jgi:hypothetical protein
VCGNENISGIPFLIEKLRELTLSSVAKRKTNSEHQLKPSLLSLPKGKEDKGFLKDLESLWPLDSCFQV